MLEILEKELKFENQSLKKLIKTKDTKKDFNLINHESISSKLFSNSQGITTYIIFILLSIFLLNKYQLILSKNNLQTIMPILYNPIDLNKEINKSSLFLK